MVAANKANGSGWEAKLLTNMTWSEPGFYIEVSGKNLRDL